MLFSERLRQVNWIGMLAVLWLALASSLQAGKPDVQIVRYALEWTIPVAGSE